MTFPFGNIIVDKTADPNTVYLFSPRYKMVPVEGGLREVIDWGATAKASAVIVNIGEGKK
jgi:hypothetical protein